MAKTKLTITAKQSAERSLKSRWCVTRIRHLLKNGFTMFSPSMGMYWQVQMSALIQCSKHSCLLLCLLGMKIPRMIFLNSRLKRSKNKKSRGCRLSRCPRIFYCDILFVFWTYDGFKLIHPAPLFNLPHAPSTSTIV